MTDPPVVRLPPDCLVVLVGAAGSGKSTFATRWFTPGEILSSDAYRALVTGDAADQRATGAAFAALHLALDRRLRDGLLTVVDATSVTARSRAALLSRAAAAGRPAVAIVLDLSPNLVLARNAGRDGRVVPEAVVLRHVRELRAALARGEAGLAAEGFAAIARFGTAAAVDSVRIVRE